MFCGKRHQRKLLCSASIICTATSCRVYLHWHLPQQVPSHKNLIILFYPDNISISPHCKGEGWGTLVYSGAGIQKLLVLYSEVHVESKAWGASAFCTNVIQGWQLRHSDLGYDKEISQVELTLSFPVRLPYNLCCQSDTAVTLLQSLIWVNLFNLVQDRNCAELKSNGVTLTWPSSWNAAGGTCPCQCTEIALSSGTNRAGEKSGEKGVLSALPFSSLWKYCHSLHAEGEVNTNKAAIN